MQSIQTHILCTISRACACALAFTLNYIHKCACIQLHSYIYDKNMNISLYTHTTTSHFHLNTNLLAQYLRAHLHIQAHPMTKIQEHCPTHTMHVCKQSLWIEARKLNSSTDSPVPSSSKVISSLVNVPNSPRLFGVQRSTNIVSNHLPTPPWSIPSSPKVLSSLVLSPQWSISIWVHFTPKHS